MTLLQIVQKTLSSLKFHNVNTIGETRESERVRDIVELVLEELYEEYDWDNRRSIGQLLVTATPNEMTPPANVDVVEWIHYTSVDRGRYEIAFVEPHKFYNKLEGRLNGSFSNIDSTGAWTDQDPSYWTTYDNDTITFDGYDGSLVASRTNCMFVHSLTLPVADLDVPDIPARWHYVVMHGVKAMAYADLRGDEAQAFRYGDKFKQGRTKMKRFLNMRNKDRTTWVNDYGRKNISVSRDISNRSVIES